MRKLDTIGNTYAWDLFESYLSNPLPSYEAWSPLILPSFSVSPQATVILDTSQQDYASADPNLDLTINAGVEIGSRTTSNFGGIVLTDGITTNVTNNGFVASLNMRTEAGEVTNSGEFGFILDFGGTFFTNTLGVWVTHTGESNVGTSTFTVNNNAGATIYGAAPISFNATNDITFENAFVNNDGTIIGTFNLIQGRNPTSTLEINNTGLMQVIQGFFGVSQGIQIAGQDVTNLNNSGIIEILSADGGGVYSDDAFAISGGPTDGGTYNLTNSGRISSTGNAIQLGGSSENDAINFINIINTSSGIIEADTNSNGDGFAIYGTSNFVFFNTPDQILENLNTFYIENDGLITGDIVLYDEDFFTVQTTLFATQLNGKTVQAFSIPGVDDPIFQDVDGNGDPINDGNGNPVFTPGTVTSSTLGDVSYSVTDGEVSLTDTLGDPIVLLPDQDDIDRGVFDDDILNSGTIDGNIDMGVGNDTYTAQGSGNVTGIIGGGLGNDEFIAGSAAETFDGGDGFDRVNYSNSTAAVNVNLTTGSVSGPLATGDTLISIENVTGTDFNDVIVGDAAGNFLFGGAGNDVLNGLNGNDRLTGGEGADVLRGGNGFDTAAYTDSASGVTVDLSTGTASGGDATGDSFFDIENLIGSDFDDILTGLSTGSLLAGEQGNDTITGLGGNDFIFDGEGNDLVFAGSGNDRMFIGAGDDVFEGEDGNDTFQLTDEMGIVNTFNGGNGFDTVDARSLTVNGSGGHDFAWNWTGSSIEQFLGSEGRDIFRLDDAVDQFAYMYGGDDFVGSSAGADFIDGGSGSDRVSYFGSTAAVFINLELDTASGGHADGDQLDNIENLSGSEFDDTLIGDANDNFLLGNDGADILNGGDGDDLIFGNEGLGGNPGGDTIDGGNGFDVVSYGFSDLGVTINLSNLANNAGEAAGDTYANIESYEGSRGNDIMIGTALDDQFAGSDGNDVLNGLDGDDTLDGGFGNDTLRGGIGVDILFGGDGNDNLFGDAFNDQLYGDAGDDILQAGGGNDYMEGGAGDDRLFAQAGDDIAYGGAGNDRLVGALGDDELFGDEGNDTLIGGGGLDDIYGGLGNDKMIGQADADRFHFEDDFGDDTIVDFEDGIDIMDFSAHSLITGFADFTLTQIGSNVRIEYGTDSILLRNMNVADITDADFDFGP